MAMQNTFVMSFLDNFSQWNKLDTRKLRTNPTKINFPTVNRKIRRKGCVDFHFISSILNFQNFTIGHQNDYFTIFLIYKTQP